MGNRVVPILLVAVTGLTVVFGITSLRSSREFSEYRTRTIGEPAIWTERDMSVDACLEFAIEWGTHCPGIQSWCEGEVPRVTRDCLASRDRTEYCSEVGSTILTTGFGFEACELLRSGVESKYARRSHKKLCAKSYRAVADHCRALQLD